MQKIADSARLFLQLHESERYSPKTLIVYKKFFNQVLPYFKGKDLNISTWREYLEYRKAEYLRLKNLELCNATINHENKCVKAYLNWLRRERLITADENFSDSDFLKPLPVQKRQGIPSWDVMSQIVEAVSEKKVYTWHTKISKEEVNEYVCAMRLMLCTGIRSGAIGTITGNSIYALSEKPSFDFRNKGGKSGERLVIPIPIQCLADMKERMAKGDKPAFTFTTPGAYQAEINTLLKEGAKLLKLNIDVKSHDFRRAYASYLGNISKMPLEDISDLLGHKDLETTRGYIQKDLNHLSDAVRDHISIKAPGLLTRDEKETALINRIEAIGINRKLINLENGRIIIDVNGF